MLETEIIKAANPHLNWIFSFFLTNGLNESIIKTIPPNRVFG